MEDDRVAILEAQLAQAKLIAEEADKKYEEVSSSVVVVFALSGGGSGDYGLHSTLKMSSSVIPSIDELLFFSYLR
jgi:hypothetical protein